MQRPLKTATSVAFALTLVACGPQPSAPSAPSTPDHASLRAIFAHWPSSQAAPIAPTPAIVALGERLYHEKALSKGKDISCASCHSLDTFGQDNRKVSAGTNGQFGKRSAPTTFNAFRQIAQFWDGRADSVETQSTMPMMTDVEHGLVSEAELETILRDTPGYPEAFQAAFGASDGDGVTAEHVRTAIGAFERTLITRSPFDRWAEGDDGALSPAQFQGLQDFVAVGCTTCHASRAVGGQMFQKLGLVKPVVSEDLGRFAVTQAEHDRYQFKVPSLLNVTATGPYLHDGRFDTLVETVRFMADVQLGKTLTDAQTESIVTFLGALEGVRP